MIRKIVIAIVVLVVLLGGAYLYLDYRNYSLSPKGEASLTNGDLEVKITYCRPSVRDRLIFGTAEDDALQPYGQYWRLGANEATEITFNQNVLLVDQEIQKGTYRMYAIPDKNYFELKLNNELGEWGAFEPDSAQDLVSIQVPANDSEHTEQFTISLEPLYDNSIKAIFEWSTVELELPIIPQ